MMVVWKRRIRAATGMGLVWAGAWFGVGMVLLAIVGLDATDVPFPLFFGPLGLLAGATFSGLLALGEGRRRFDQMSLGRFAGWEAIGGVTLPAPMSIAAGVGFLGLAMVFALAGGGSPAGLYSLPGKGERLAGRLGSGSTGNLEGPDRE